MSNRLKNRSSVSNFPIGSVQSTTSLNLSKNLNTERNSSHNKLPKLRQSVNTPNLKDNIFI